MTDISLLRRAHSASAMAATGVVITLGTEFYGLKLRVRPVTDAYDDIMARAKSELVRQKRAEGLLKGRDGYDRIPQSDRVELGNRLALEHLFVEPLELTLAGKPIDAKQYREMAQTEQFSDLMDAVWAAVEEATEQSRARVKVTEGNSSPPSDTSSITPAKPE